MQLLFPENFLFDKLSCVFVLNIFELVEGKFIAFFDQIVQEFLVLDFEDLNLGYQLVLIFSQDSEFPLVILGHPLIFSLHIPESLFVLKFHSIDLVFKQLILF